MKKFITLAVALISAFVAVFATGCGNDAPANNSDDGNGNLPVAENISVYVPDGAPALSIAKFINDNETFGSGAKVEYNVVAANEINNAVLVKKADIVIMPLNAATKVYKTETDTAEYALAAVITHGNFYIMSQSSVSSAEDLIGKVVYVPNRGQVPDWTFKYALSAAGVNFEEGDSAVSDKVVINYPTGGASAIPALLLNDVNAVGLLPEPAATNVNSKKNGAVAYRLDLQELYDATAKSYPQAVMMVKKSSAKAAELALKIAEKLSDAVAWVKANKESAVTAVKSKYEASTLNPATLKDETIDNCKIYWQGAADAKTVVLSYIENIRSIDGNAANAVGDDFFLL